MSSTSADAKKRCGNCLEYVKTYITCFKCDAAYHIFCWKKVPGAYLNERRQLNCCGLTSNYANTYKNFETQDNPLEKVIEKEDLDGDKEDLEKCSIKKEDSEWNEFKCDACLLEFTTNEHLENHYSECRYKEEGFAQDLTDVKDFDNCLHKEEDLEWNEFQCATCLSEFTNKEDLKNHYSKCPSKEGESIQELNGELKGFLQENDEKHFQKESYEQHIEQCDDESSYSQFNMDNDMCITNTKRDPAQVDDKEKKDKGTVCNCSTHTKGCVVKCMCIHRNERPFKCDVCDYAAAQKYNLNTHIKIKHSGADKQYKCGDCEYSSHKKNHLVRHMHTHSDEKPFQCDMCNYAATEKNCLSVHILAKHSDADKKYKCKDCKYSTHTKMHLVRHVRTHTSEKPFKCDMCEYAAARKEVLKMHVLARHFNSDKKYKCRDCEYSTHRKEHLVDHVRTHTNEKRFKCDMCGYAAVQKSNLKAHVLTRHSNPDNEYKCKECDYSSCTKRGIVNHIRTHTNEIPFKCDTCDYTATLRKSLLVHINAKHFNASKDYKCKDCEYSTYRKDHLVEHMRTHTNEKPFRCHMCDYAATRRYNLNVHIKIKHSNADKKYKCGDCEYSTHTKAYLAKHVRVHTNEKPFKCDMCNYAAALISNLKMHVLRKHFSAEKMCSLRSIVY